MASDFLRIVELDEAGKITATYIQTDGESKETSRIDLIPPANAKSIWQRGLDVFLPVGYPHSVTHDYLEYQIYDSLQAFSSSIAGMLSSRAVLSSVGVGDSTASPTAALLFSVLQETAGRLATILFAHRLGTSLEPECKMYRLLADILNDMAFILDCLSPIFPKAITVILLSFSSILRSLCGVAAGSAKASLSAHFARWGNLGELNAKDSSQETVISLMGMLAGSIAISRITSPLATWTSLVLLLSIHLETNRRAVRAVSMRTLNRQRATFVCHHLQRGHVPTPEEVSSQERIFERDGVLRSADDRVLGYCTVGASMARLLKAIANQHSTTKATKLENGDLAKVMALYKESSYILWHDKSSQPSRRSLYIVFKKGVNTQDMLTAWWQALIVAGAASSENDGESRGIEAKLAAAEQAMGSAAALARKYNDQLKQKGWDLESGALETMACSRVVIER